MFETFTERARRAIFFARYEADQLNSNSIQAEHMILGLLRELDRASHKFLDRINVNIELLRKNLTSNLAARELTDTDENACFEIPINDDVKHIFQNAIHESSQLKHNEVDIEHILLGVLRANSCSVIHLFEKAGVNIATAKEVLLESIKGKATANKGKEHPLLTKFAKNLSELAKQNSFDCLVGRATEIERITQIMSRRRKNNPILLGEAGVGKTAIIEGLAQNIYKGKVPTNLKNKLIYALDLSLVVADTTYRGQFEERLKAIVKEASEDPNVILFIDEIHSITGAGDVEGGLDAANILKPGLSRGNLQCIGATTHKEFAKHISKDRSLVRRFQPVNIAPTNEAETINILHGIQDRYESFHNVKYNTEAIHAAVHLSNRYISDRFLPDKAIDLIDEAGARVSLRRESTRSREFDTKKELQKVASEMDMAITNRSFAKAMVMHQKEISLKKILQDQVVNSSADGPDVQAEVHKLDIEDIVASWTGIQAGALRADDKTNLLQIEDYINERVIGQSKAVSAVSRAIRRARTGIKNPNRPTGSFLFLGPTGVGKTELAKVLAQFLFGDRKKMIRFDMSEFMEKHAVSKLLGASPGYVGYGDGGMLTDKIRHNPYCIILFDEIEKAHPDVTNILLQILDDGMVTDAFGNLVDFKNTIIIMTSNLGSRELFADKNLGFIKKSSHTDSISADAIKALKRNSSPEFLNRIDEIVVFGRLNGADLQKIAHLLIDELNNTLKQHKISVAISDQACAWLVNTTTQDRMYGARPLRRAIQKHIEDPLADLMITNIKSPLVGMVNFDLVDEHLLPRCTHIKTNITNNDVRTTIQRLN